MADPHDLDIAKTLALSQFDVALLEQLEERQEADDDFHAISEVRGQTTETDAPDTRQLVDQFDQRVADRRLDDAQMEQIDLGHRLGGGGPHESRMHLRGLHTFEQIGHECGVAFVGSAPTGIRAISSVGQTTENLTHVLERLALEQPGQQQIPLLPQRQLLVEIHVLATRQQATGLQFDQGGGNQQELGGHLEVQRLHGPQLAQIRVHDDRQADLVDVHLLLEDQVQQEIERPLEHRGGNVDGHVAEANRRDQDRTPFSTQYTFVARVITVSLTGVTRVLSCIQPTGGVHLGNYLGALRNWVIGQHECDAFHGIVDLHALTVTDRPGLVGPSTLELAATLFAGGLDPEVATVFVQSHVPEHSQLSWITECTVSYGELSRMTQFKDKAAKREADFVSAGLFTYPALQAADILLYDADEVPVGEDQRQHVEITRDIAMRFNSRFGETFVVPKVVTPKAGAKVTDLQEPTAKMSKSSNSDAGIVYLLDEPAAIMKKFKRAVTDSDGEVRFDRATKPGVSNLLEILAACTGRSPAEVAGSYSQYGPLKNDAGHAVVELLTPIQHRYRELMGDRAELSRLLRRGADKAREVASRTLQRTYDNIGLLSPN